MGINSQVQEELRERYNPEGSELRRLQNHLLILLRYVDHICRENNINYWLSSGSCLGAVRHGGFIPWDDDIDIEMTRADYEKFEKIWRDNDDFILQSHKNDLYYTHPFSKVRLRNTFMRESDISKKYEQNGIFLDIFVMERSNILLAKISHGILGSLRHFSYHIKRNRITDFLFLILKKVSFGILTFFRMFSFLSKKKELRHTLGTGLEKNIRVKEEIFPITEMIFEGESYPVPGNTDKYLYRMFKNYMQLPEEIYTHILHDIKFLSDEDYKRLNSQPDI